MKIQKRIFLALVLFITFVPLLGLIFHLDSPNYASSELSKEPKFMIEGKLNPNITKEIDTYYSDHFAFRSAFVSLYHDLLGTLFHSSPHPKVVVGKDEWLFFGETTNEMLYDEQLTVNDVQRIKEVLRIQRDFVTSLGKKFAFTIAPNKASIYPEKLPYHKSPVGDFKPLDLFHKDVPEYYIDLYHLLKDHKKEDLYLLRDSHWNNRGAHLAYREILSAYGFTPMTFQETNDLSEEQGDLDRMFTPSFLKKEAQTTFNTERDYAFTRPIKTHEDIFIKTQKPKGEGSLYIFRDSFFNALLPFFSKSFKTVSYDRVIPYDYRNVLAEPTDVLVEIVERNLDWLLQGTPVIPAKKVEKKEAPLGDRSATILLEERKGYHYLNAKWNQPSDDILAVSVSIGGEWYEAFPVYEDGLLDEEITRGFSLYVEKPIDSLEVYYNTSKGWFKAR
ncbi:alginate O-acetyltransferase AlgX-related protein [Guggenheimella bovis]